MQLKTTVSYAFLEHYCSHTIPTEWGDANILALLGETANAYATANYPQEMLERIMQVGVHACTDGLLFRANSVGIQIDCCCQFRSH